MVFSKDMKFAICFGLIIGALFSFCSLCFASSLDVITVDGLIVNAFTGEIITSPGGLKYIYVTKGHTYTISSDVAFNVFLSSSVPSVGLSVDVLTTTVYSYTYTAETDGYILAASTRNPQYITITFEEESLGGFIDYLVNVITFGSLSDIIVVAVPIIAISVIFTLGFYLVKRIMNKIKRAKGGV